MQIEIVDWALERRRWEDLVRKRVVVVAGDEEGETSLWSGKKTKRKPIPLPLFFVSFADDIKPILSLSLSLWELVVTRG